MTETRAAYTTAEPPNLVPVRQSDHFQDSDQTFTPQQIAEQQAILEAALEELETAKRNLKTAKARLQKMVPLVNLSGNELLEWVFDQYWHSRIYAKTLQSLIKSRYDGAGPAWSEVIAAKATMICQVCEQPFTRIFTGRTDFENANRSPPRCPSCAPLFPPNLPDRTVAQTMKVEHLRSLPYDEYLKTDHWQSIRTSMLIIAQYTCQQCGATDTELHVHHRTYATLGQEAFEDLLVLCADCHAKIHDKEPVNG